MRLRTLGLPALLVGALGGCDDEKLTLDEELRNTKIAFVSDREVSSSLFADVSRPAPELRSPSGPGTSAGSRSLVAHRQNGGPTA